MGSVKSILHRNSVFFLIFVLVFGAIYVFPLNSLHAEQVRTSTNNNEQKSVPLNNPSDANSNKNVGKKSPAAGDENAPAYEFKAPTFEETRVSYPLLILKTVAILVAIVASIFFLFKFLVKSRHKIITESDIIKVLATFPLSANKVIQIIDIGGKVLVLGITDSNINLITTIEDKEVIDSIKLQYSKEKVQKTGFKDQFLKLIGGGVFTKSGQISYLDSYKKRIKRMKKL